VISHNSPGGRMPLSKSELADECGYPFDNHARRRQKQQARKIAVPVVEVVTSSNLIHLREVVATKQQLDEQAVGSDPAGGSYS
jgi:hypothetical protein